MFEKATDKKKNRIYNNKAKQIKNQQEKKKDKNVLLRAKLLLPKIRCCLVLVVP